MKKLLATTAIVSVSFASVALAEVTVKGSIEQTINSRSYNKAANEHKGTGSMGQETNLTVSSSGELDNGLSIKGSFRSEDGSVDHSSIKVSGDTLGFEIGADTGSTIHTQINPTVGDSVWFVTGAQGDDGFTTYEAHDVQHIGIDAKLGGMTAAVNYAPSNNGISAGDSNKTDAGGSATEMLLKGSIMEGVNFLIGQEKIEAANSGGSEETEKTYQVSYSAGQFALGASIRDFDDGDSTATAGTTDEVTYLTATYAVNDQVSLGIQSVTAESEGTGTSATDEETLGISLGYNLGPIGVEVMYAETDNLAHSNADDVEGVQIRTVYKF
ncbi:hypothetical protein HIMB114_00003820 [alpha proteobacterium HIMB114]|nr:hypothetical protein HIMB114_00003820 [alpha proteobacterium HIMB114]